MKRALRIGNTGQNGSYLTELLIESGLIDTRTLIFDIMPCFSSPLKEPR